ncbi:MAG: DNA ligase D [Solirubrobacteraceae bacterium]|nr:DNA ligase D [Solirubrobacteraceae bacterium]
MAPPSPSSRASSGTPAPMLATPGELPADDEGWAYEVKWDGVRAIVAVTSERVQITSRGGLDLSPAFPELTPLAAALGQGAVLDGEIIAFDDHGLQRFDAIQKRLRTTGTGVIARLAQERPATLAIFDVLDLAGETLTGRPWHERREVLESLALDDEHWQVPPAHVGEGTGAGLLAATEAQQLEGIIAKRMSSIYRPGARSPDWLKIKHRRRQEVVIGGWTTGTGRRARTLGAVQVGVYENSVLRHIGGVGSGLKEADLTELRERFAELEAQASPFGAGSPPRGTHFVRPELVCEVEFTGWSDDGQLRHPVFRGLRADKPAREVVREPEPRRPADSAPGGVSFTGEHGDAPEALVDGRRLRVTNLEKPMYGEAAFTKRQVIEYYAQIAPVLLPHFAGRATTLRRFPHGAADPASFYEKRANAHRPDWVRTVPMPIGDDEIIDFVEVADTPTLVWLANLAALELHPSLSRAVDPDEPTALVFDLDPGPPATVVECCRVALLIRALLTQLDLDIWAKTSGGKGLQVYAPINVPVTYDDTKAFAHAVAALLEDREPGLVTSRMAKRLRPGKVFVDWGQNDRHKTTVGVYSLRAQPQPTVSTPVSWDEVEACAAAGDPAQLRFTAPQVLARVAELGDLFAPVATLRQSLPALGGPT